MEIIETCKFGPTKCYEELKKQYRFSVCSKKLCGRPFFLKNANRNPNYRNISFTDHFSACLKDASKPVEPVPSPNHFIIPFVGYSVSLIALLIAFFIFITNKRLKSPKNILHINLFMSFILRCLLFHVQALNVTQNDLPTKNVSMYSSDLALPNKNFICKFLTVIWQFSLLANYNWILMESVYLHCLISTNKFVINSNIIRYLVFGWSTPAFLVIPWSVSKYYYENSGCWVSIDNTYIFWCFIKGPITLSIVVSFAIFLNVIRILYLKIFSSELQNQINSKYSKLFKSTLILVPTFGVPYILFLALKFLTFEKELILLYFELIFASFQGLFVSSIYCFFSSEVRIELLRSIQRFKSKEVNSSLKHSRQRPQTFLI